MISIEFNLNYYLIYNSNIPDTTNFAPVLQQTQQSLLSQCIFNSTVKINSISAPIILKTNAILKTDNTRKKRRLDIAECGNDEKLFSLICNNTQELRECDLEGIQSFLETYLDQSVKT
jgi:hypothetical protein